jgi:hypothetical protein
MQGQMHAVPQGTSRGRRTRPKGSVGSKPLPRATGALRPKQPAPNKGKLRWHFSVFHPPTADMERTSRIGRFAPQAGIAA